MVLSQDDNVELGEGRHFGDLFPLPGVQPVDIHRESVDGEGRQGSGASGALLFITFTFLQSSRPLFGVTTVTRLGEFALRGWLGNFVTL